MAAALHPPRNDAGPNHSSIYPRALMTDLDFRDNRYPTLPTQTKTPQRASAMIFGASNRSSWDNGLNINGEFPPRRSLEPNGTLQATPWALEQQNPSRHLQQAQVWGVGTSAEIQSLSSRSQQSQSQEPSRSTLSYALPSGAARRVVERYSLDDNDQRTLSRASTDTRPTVADPSQDQTRNEVPEALQQTIQDRSILALPTTLRNSPSNPAIDVAPKTATNFPHIMPLSASPSYNPPIAPKHRAYAQQPTYITPPTTPTPINTVYSPRPPPPEEVCVECAMRDQDMADVDVTSPGIWERESDTLFEDLKRREFEDDAKGLVTIDDPKRPRVKGGRLTEQNLKLWLSVNPREPASRQQTLNTYIKSQRTLLEAEALAHARAMQEAKQLDSRMRDTYSQLRRSAYDMGSNPTPADDSGGVRIKPPLSPSSPINIHNRSHSREITLLENGMIVEHVDVRKEERDARERRKKEERRARKSSRGSMMDVTSIISAQSLGPPLTDSGVGLKPYSRYSQTSSARPTSVLTAPHERPDLPRAYSQASFSDIHSLGSASPRRTRFFGIKNLSAGWRSQDSLAPSGMSGSMIDMHVALQREAHGQYPAHPPTELHVSRRSRIWATPGLDATPNSHDAQSESKPKKKKKGFAKIWRIVTGSGKHDGTISQDASQSLERNDDDLPLAPPPPLSYLVDRGPSELRPVSGRHASTPSLPSLISPKLILALPDTVDAKNTSGTSDDQVRLHDDMISNNQSSGTRNVHPVTSEPDMRQHVSQNLTIPSPIPNYTTSTTKSSSLLSREKSLPPLPGEPGSRMFPNGSTADPRPRTVHTYDPRQIPSGSSPMHDFLPPNAPFRGPDIRRQSFGGMSSRPNLVVQTLPLTSKQPVGLDPHAAFGPQYDEFGFSRRSLGRLEHVQEQSRPLKTPTTTPKRKSRFGFSTFLGKKNASQEVENTNENTRHQFPSMRRSGSDGQDELTPNGYATSTSRHSALSAGGPTTRMSVTSRKVLEERVSQDPDFVAYRYPSNDQRLDLLR
ncbi:hypothetical protein BDZ94DRAFT_1323411 [Collybia nuda]|uniref:Proteophosphoglycan ppg4 n=1 Tax=Collybia nuda TaxID=64659 RepID=A0A9P6CGH6_9AGAR|nr:hypothetical protein BDZ94DRAFT_1323411 [Collybia nuda]